MTLIIDGYNLLHASGILGRGRGPGYLERSRQALLNCLVESLPAAELERTTVVFDAVDPPWGVPRQTRHAGMTVVFASHYPDADSYIEEFVGKYSAPRKLTMVSSDHRLHRIAKRRKANPVDSDIWFRDLLRNRSQQQSTSNDENSEKIIKPEGPFSEGEVAFWLKQFELNE